VKQHLLNAKIDNSLHNEDDFCVEKEKVLDDGDGYDAAENRHKDVAGQEDADQDIHEDHADTTTRDKGDGAENIPVEEIQPRPRKPPDTGCIILERINPGVLCPTGGLENILRFDKNVNGGDHANAASDQAEEEEDVNKNIAAIVDVNVHTHIDEGGGAGQVNMTNVGTDLSTGDDHVHTHIDEGGGAFQVTEHRAVTKYDVGGVIHDCVINEHDNVDEEAEFTKEIGPDESSRSVMRKPVKRSPSVQKKPVREPLPDRYGDVHVGGEQVLYVAADRDQGVLHYNEDDVVPGQDGAADDPIERGPAPAGLTKQVGTAESLYKMEESLMTKRDWFVYAAADGDFAVAQYNEAGGNGTVNATFEKAVDLTKVVEDQGDVHVPAHIDEGGGQGELNPAVDNDEGGESIPTLEDKEAGRLGMLMTKRKCFGHERGGGIAKSACGNCALHAGSER
jgi:hypothetical protein